MKLKDLAFVCGLCISVGNVYANENNIPEFLKGSVYHKVGVKQGIDPSLLYAVSLTESAASNSKSDVAPSIYAIRTPDGAIYPKSLTEAKLALKRSLKRYSHRELDVGLMQINGQHWQRLDNKYALFNPYFNVSFSAGILKKAMNSTSNKQIGIGRYHSYTQWRAENYGSRVLAIYNNLKKID